jgi:hypothetical protein
MPENIYCEVCAKFNLLFIGVFFVMSKLLMPYWQQ